MKHILMIANDTTFVYHLRRELLGSLVGSGCKVTLVCQELAFRPELEKIGVQLIPVETQRQGTNIAADMGLILRYGTILRRLRPDLVLTNNIKPNLYGGICCRLLGIPYIPNITGLGTALEQPGWLQRLTTHLYRLGAGHAKAILFQNRENLSFFRSRKMLSKGARVILLPGSGVNLEAFPLLPYPEETQRHFLFAARILKEKGIDLYLAAARIIRTQYPDTRFHICGSCDDPSYLPVLKAAEAEGWVIWHGQQRDMLPFFRQACCLVHPSYYPEGMSNVLLEAAACARPVITTQRSGCAEAVDAGKSGFLIPTQDAGALVAALEAFLAMPWEQCRAMGLAGRAKMEREFDRTEVVRRIINEVNSI